MRSFDVDSSVLSPDIVLLTVSSWRWIPGCLVGQNYNVGEGRIKEVRWSIKKRPNDEIGGMQNSMGLVICVNKF